ncbi:DUF4157 domain-containing protein [Methanosarcina sp. DH2]|uniref:eCIS core domain-containing protein n=1 Tax=Methanosarcina sp. DH2 TaxID=2605639 RepID=UPI001E61E05F|nr:DUF4157 domain-containing protein [Methanosarcina sp. DH2]MCC4769555.1 DUF4157 domain-containing protein [Methanosarcina sp. DH2]
MVEKTGVQARTQETKQKCSNFCSKKLNYNSSGSPADRILQLQRTAGNQAVQRLIKSRALQAKIRVGQPNDIYEREADRVAEQVMRMPDPVLQRKCTMCDENEKKVLQAKESQGQLLATQGQSMPPLVHQVLSSPGQPLDPGTRAFMEPRFDHDFSRVKVHLGAAAEQSAREMNAHAYTVGHNMVFDAGRFAPGTHEGRRLIAHELTHVVQQSKGGVDPMVQRRLLVSSDSKADIKTMLKLLEPASGFSLKHDPKTKEVSVTASVLKPPSFVLASQLATIISDQKQDAEIHLGRKQKGVSVGAFPSDPDRAVQEIRIDHVLALEKGAPGSGVAKLAHEIVENYEAHALKDFNWSVAFSESHKMALEVENLIESELGHPGSRRNTFSVLIDPGKGKPRFSRGIEDREKYFLVWDESFDSKNTWSNARRVPRVKVSNYKINGFTLGSNNLPKGGDAIITSLAADLKKNPTASALVEGFASAGSTYAENIKLAEEWARMVSDKVIDKVADKLNTNWRRFHVVGNVARTGNYAVITVERPDL